MSRTRPRRRRPSPLDPTPHHHSEPPRSWSPGTGTSSFSSDVDLFVVRPPDVDVEDAGWRGQLEDLAVRIRRWTGNHASVIEVCEEDLPGLRRSRRDTVRDLRAQAIALAGPPVAELLGNR